MLGLVLVATLLWTSVQVQAFLFTVGSPTQCDALTISWSGETRSRLARVYVHLCYRRDAAVPIACNSSMSICHYLLTS